MAVPYLHVVAVGGQWRWEAIAPCGRALVTSPDLFDDDLVAITAGKHWRKDWMAKAEAIDGKPCR